MVHVCIQYMDSVLFVDSTESSDSMGGGTTTPHGVDDKLGSAFNPNRAEMPGSKRNEQVSLVPRLFPGGRKRAWYTLYAHSRN